MSWSAGFISVSIICFILGKAANKIRDKSERILLMLFAPYVVSFVLFWSVAIYKGVASQQASYAGLFIHLWAVAGIFSITIGGYAFSRFNGRLR